jgi:DNA polymerase III delta prime subunit
MKNYTIKELELAVKEGEITHKPQINYIKKAAKYEEISDKVRKEIERKFDKLYGVEERPWSEKKDEMLEIEDEIEDKNDFYDFMRAEDEAKNELKEWFLNLLRNDKLGNVPKDTKETILSADRVGQTRIASRLIDIALSVY